MIFDSRDDADLLEMLEKNKNKCLKCTVIGPDGKIWPEPNEDVQAIDLQSMAMITTTIQ